MVYPPSTPLLDLPIPSGQTARAITQGINKIYWFLAEHESEGATIQGLSHWTLVISMRGGVVWRVQGLRKKGTDTVIPTPQLGPKSAAALIAEMGALGVLLDVERLE
jgi:hypothetical protein